MKTEQLDYELPAGLIAQQPAADRTDSRLLVVDRARGTFVDSVFRDLDHFLRPSDCLVLNDTRVLAARFLAKRQTGGRLEGLFLAEPRPGTWEAMIKGSGRLKPGEQITLLTRDGQPYGTAQVLERQSDARILLSIGSADGPAVLDRIGLAPLPPYIKRHGGPGPADLDRVRYQTVYARSPGAVAAPTAGLHFTTDLLDQLLRQGIELNYLTLHVGTGTFKPVTSESLEDHPIHAEQVTLSGQTAAAVNRAKASGRRVVAVGTTSTRALESAAVQTDIGWEVRQLEGKTQLFITPGYRFKVVDCLITNFHLPRSTLLALVAALAGLDLIMAAYRHAVDQQYRFYSYGDAMLIL
jgi:S-adenosylmethionine:tRNA ribosyltransferase-isomerase